MEVTFRKYFSDKAVGGQIVRVDKIRLGWSFSGYELRVVGVWKKPAWFDVGWFAETEKRHRKKKY